MIDARLKGFDDNIFTARKESGLSERKTRLINLEQEVSRLQEHAPSETQVMTMNTLRDHIRAVMPSDYEIQQQMALTMELLRQMHRQPASK
jgi:hypothetical protein